MARSRLRKFGYLLLFLIIGGGIVWFGFSAWLEWSLRTALNSGSENRFQLEFKDLKLEPDFSGVRLSKVKLIPNLNDTTNVFNGSIGSVEISGLEWSPLLFNRVLKIDLLVFETPRFAVDRIRSKEKKISDRSSTISDVFGDILNRIHLKRFFVYDGSLEFTEDGNDFITIRNMDLEAWGLVTDSLLAQRFFPFSIDSLRIEMREFTTLSDSVTQFGFGNFNYFTRKDKGELQITDLYLKSLIDPMEIAKRRKTEQGIITMKLDTLEFLNLSPESRVTGEFDILSTKARVKGLAMNVFKNKNYPLGSRERKPSFSQMIRNIPFPFSVDSSIVENSTIRLEIRGSGPGDGTAIVDFEYINGWIYNISNRPEDHGEGSMARVQLDLQTNGSIDVHSTLEIHYDEEVHEFWVESGSFPFMHLNPSLVPLTGIRIEQGFVSSLKLHSYARRDKAWNQCDISYEDLQIKILDEREGDPKWLLSIAANTLIRSNRPHADVAVEYISERDIARPAFQFLWIPIRDGMLEALPTNLGKQIIDPRLGSTMVN